MRSTQLTYSSSVRIPDENQQATCPAETRRFRTWGNPEQRLPLVLCRQVAKQPFPPRVTFGFCFDLTPVIRHLERFFFSFQPVSFIRVSNIGALCSRSRIDSDNRTAVERGVRHLAQLSLPLLRVTSGAAGFFIGLLAFFTLCG